MSKQEELLILALRKALESPDGLEMLTRKGVLGLFPNSPAGKQAAQSALNQGWLQKKGYHPIPSRQSLCITCQGIEWLMESLKVPEMLTKAAALVEKASQQSFKSSLWQTLASSLSRIALSPNENQEFQKVSRLVLLCLKEWQDQGRAGDCPLPKLFKFLIESGCQTTFGKFHDVLRHLHARKLVDLHPWTGPLYEIAEPSLAMMFGHEICYYACLGTLDQVQNQITDEIPMMGSLQKGIYHEPTTCK